MFPSSSNNWPTIVPPPPPRVQEPAMFDRRTEGWFLRTLSPLNLTAEPGAGSSARPWATPYRGKKNFRRIAPGHACPLLSVFFLLPAPHKFEVQSLAMNKGEALIGRLPSISLAAVTITIGFVQVMHVHQGRLWGQVIPHVGRQCCADVLCHGHCQPSSWCQVWCSQCEGCRITGHVRWVLGDPVS